jgi:hypothetical protein
MPRSNSRKIIVDGLEKLRIIFFAASFLTIGLLGCHGLMPSSQVELRAFPEEIAITKALLRKPVQFRGWGYAPEEYIIVDLIIPKGVKIKQVPEGEKFVRIAYAISDEYGTFKATMGAKETLDWFFQLGWKNNVKPIFKEATPLPPGKYEIRAAGLESERFGVTILTVVKPSEERGGINGNQR